MPQRQPRKRAPRPSGAPDRGDGELTGAGEVRTAYITGNSFHARAVQYVVVDGDALFEGDIVLGPADLVEQESQVLQAELRGELAAAVLVSGPQFRWPNGVVPYTIDPLLPNTARVTDSIAHWHTHTNVRFVLRTAANAATFPDYVTFRPGSGCSSSVGKRGGQQFVNLGPNCTTGNTIHEIGHTVGLWHEQSREDRDAFVRISWANIQAGFEHNFNQHITDGDDVGAYDYGSIMHYPRAAFGIDGAETITPLDAGAHIGQRTALSPGDIAAANSMVPSKRPVETGKERVAETTKERFPETIKEIIPESIKRWIPENVRVGTLVEPTRSTVPFALRTTSVGGASDPAFDELAARLAIVEAVLAELQDGQAAVAEQVAATLVRLGSS